MTERIRFTVTQEHIDRGCSDHDAHLNCPIARALREATPDHDWHVWGPLRGERKGLATEGPYTAPYARWTLSTRTCRFIRTFDAGKPVAPFTGEVYRT